MDNFNYIFIYHCRYCGKNFTQGITGKRVAFSCLVQSACDLPRDAQHPGDTIFHYEEDHIGLADLVGCKRVLI